MYRLLVNEIRRLLQMKRIYIYTAGAITISALFIGYSISTSGTDIVNNDGTVTIIQGVAAISHQKQVESVLQGEIRAEDFAESLHVIQEAYDAASNHFIYDESFFFHLPCYSTLYQLFWLYPQYTKDAIGIASNATPDQIPERVAYNFYALRTKKIEQILTSRYGGDEAKLARALEMNKEVSEPFSFYPGYLHWINVLGRYELLLTIIVGIATLFAAQIFIECYHNGSDPVFRTTKYGRTHLGVVRLIVVLLYGIFLVLLTSAVYLGAAVFTIGSEGLRSAIQMGNIYSIANFTYGQIIIYMIVCGLVSIMGMVSLASLFSAISKKPVNAVIASIVLILSYKGISLFRLPSWMNILMSTFPLSGTDSFNMIEGHQMYQIFNVAIWEPYWSIGTGILLGVVFCICAVCVYKKGRY